LREAVVEVDPVEHRVGDRVLADHYVCAGRRRRSPLGSPDGDAGVLVAVAEASAPQDRVVHHQGLRHGAARAAVAENPDQHAVELDRILQQVVLHDHAAAAVDAHLVGPPGGHAGVVREGAVRHQGRARVRRVQGDPVVPVAAAEVVGDGDVAAGRPVRVVDVDAVAP